MGGSKTISTSENRLAGIALQSSSYGGVLPILYGTSRLAANLIDYDDFTAIPHTTSQHAGKGGGTTMSNTTYTYTAGVIMALCEGPISGVNRVWRDKKIGTLAGYGFTLLTGTRPQSPWSVWTTKHPSKALGYSGVAQVCHAAIPLASGGTMQNHTFEVTGFSATEQDPNYTSAYDARPEAVILDFLTNQFYGAGWDSSKIASMTTGAASYATYCQACGFVISPLFNEQKSAGDHLQTILDATNSEAIWSAGASGMQLKIIPYGDTSITANGTTYTPNTTPLYDLTYDDFLGVLDDQGNATGNDPITVTRTSTQDVFNCHPVEYWDRLNSYNTSVVEDPDPVDVAISGMKKAQPSSLHMITRGSHALQISRIMAQKSVWIRNTYTFKVGWKYILLEPMDLVTLTDPKLGLVRKVVRIVSVDMPDETSEKDGLTVVAEEWPFGTATATLYTTQNSGGTIPNIDVAPGNANAPVIADLPLLLAPTEGSAYGVLVTSGGANWGGAEVWLSYDNAAYEMVGQITKPGRHGTISANLAQSTNTNLALQSETFTTSPWAATNATAAVNAVLRPDSAATTAATLTDSATNAQHYISQSISGLTIGQTYTASVYAKVGTLNFAYIQLGSSYAGFNLSNGSFDTGSGGLVYQITSVGGGWYRISVQRVAAATSETLIVGIYQTAATLSYAGSSKNALIWGAQVELGSLPGTYHVTTSSTASGASFTDTGDTLGVDLTVSAGVLSNLNQQGMLDVQLPWLILDGANTEVGSYQTATLTAANKYNLTLMQRGCYGSANAAHTLGASFAILDDAAFQFPIPNSRVGSQVWIKLVSFNTYGGGKQDISAVTAYTYTPGSAGGFQIPLPSGVTVAASNIKPS